MNGTVAIKIGSNIRKLREAANITQAELATRMQTAGCDLTRGTIAKIETGLRYIYPDEMILLKDILGASYDEILDMR